MSTHDVGIHTGGSDHAGSECIPRIKVRKSPARMAGSTRPRKEVPESYEDLDRLGEEIQKQLAAQRHKSQDG